MPGNIDYDRGVMKKMDESTGVKVYMYFDDPGVYLNIFGAPVAEALAKAAGYDVELFAKQKLRKDLIAKAIASVDADVGALGAFEPKVVARAGGITVKLVNEYDGHVVVSAEGDKLSPYVMPKAAAMHLLKQLAPGVPVEEVTEADKNPDVTSEDLEPKEPKRKARSFADI